MSIKTSECVSLGHPDKVADYISSYILDRYIERDPKTRYALEVQIKGEFVTLGGEITSDANFSHDEIESFVRSAVNDIGYTRAYQCLWGEENTICGDNLVVEQHITKQSPDIARGVDNSGWGDQGIFFGMAVNDKSTSFMPKDWFLARQICKRLYEIRYAGIDIKTQITMCDDKVKEFVVAIPMLEKHTSRDVAAIVDYFCANQSEPYSVIVNGTGCFEKHGPVADCGTTGRKLVVDFYGGNCLVGGGAPWTKDGSKADLSLNLYARKIAMDYIEKHPECAVVYSSIYCRIGSPDIVVVICDSCGSELYSYRDTVHPQDLIGMFSLDMPRFAFMCREGLFGC